MTNLIGVVTTIQRPTSAIISLAERLHAVSAQLIAVGDRKGPDSFELENALFFGLSAQLEMPFELARLLPVGHYARKNLGYLEAIRRLAACIYETDDDNAPLENWTPRSESVDARAVVSAGWINVYRLFTGERIWPRGLPLDALLESFQGEVPVAAQEKSVRAPIQQGLANGSPDVDAVWRLVLDRPFDFEDRPSVWLPPGAWCPFNSQSTWWWPDAYLLMYLPSYCSFRMTDIWRSFIAQRCLWEIGLGVVFHGAEVLQERNLHDLMRDFNDEIPGYQRNRELVEVLLATSLRPGRQAMAGNLTSCYEALVSRNFFPQEELALVSAWCAGVAEASGPGSAGLPNT